MTSDVISAAYPTEGEKTASRALDEVIISSHDFGN